MLIHNFIKHDIRRKSHRFEISAFVFYNFNHVRKKFLKTNEVLISRLGTAITQRRKYLSYRERHAVKFKQGLLGKASGADTATMGGLSDTIATDPQQRNIDFEDHVSDSGVFETSYAPTLKGGGNITIPPAPKASHNGEPFECPFCYHIIVLDRGHSWAKHVFQDLQPYLCLEADCVTPQRMYTNRREWIYHMRNVHTKSERQEKPDGRTSSNCPLCEFVCANSGYLDKHVARHMQELALFVLPQDDEDLDEDSNSSEAHISSADSLSGNESLDEEGKHSAIDDTPKPELALDPGAHEAVSEHMVTPSGEIQGFELPLMNFSKDKEETSPRESDPRYSPLSGQVKVSGKIKGYTLSQANSSSGSEDEEEMNENVAGLNEPRRPRKDATPGDYGCHVCDKIFGDMPELR